MDLEEAASRFSLLETRQSALEQRQARAEEETTERLMSVIGGLKNETEVLRKRLGQCFFLNCLVVGFLRFIIPNQGR